MTNETQQQNTTEHNMPLFGMRLQSAREALGLERKEAAAQLRLNENLIMLLEKDNYPTDVPATFLRGYIRAYGKLLQIPEHEIKNAVDPIQPSPNENVTVIKPANTVTSGDYFMQISTYLIIFTLLGLVGIWWYTHSTASITTESQALNLPETLPPTTAPSTLQTAGAAATALQQPTMAHAAAPVVENTNQTAAPEQHAVPAKAKQKVVAQEQADEEDTADNTETD